MDTYDFAAIVTSCPWFSAEVVSQRLTDDGPTVSARLQRIIAASRLQATSFDQFSNELLHYFPEGHDYFEPSRTLFAMLRKCIVDLNAMSNMLAVCDFCRTQSLSLFWDARTRDFPEPIRSQVDFLSLGKLFEAQELERNLIRTYPFFPVNFTTVYDENALHLNPA